MTELNSIMLSKPVKTDPKLLEALREAAAMPMTEEQIKEQKESWVRAMRATGDPRFD